MVRFHILEVKEGKSRFREVAGIPLLIGGVTVFEATQSSRIYDAVTGARLEARTYAGKTPLSRSMCALQRNGVLWWRDTQMAFSAKYGLPPEIETCGRTHCGHH